MNCKRCSKEAVLLKVIDPIEGGVAGLLCADCKHSFESDVQLVKTELINRLDTTTNSEEYAIAKGEYDEAVCNIGVDYFGYGYYFG